MTTNSHLQHALRNASDRRGNSLLDLSNASPVLVALLRHTGCPFCVEALDDLKDAKAEITASGVNIAVVMQTHDANAASAMLERFQLNDAHLILDPERRLYAALDVKKGNLWQLFGPHVLVRVFQVLAKGLKPAKKIGGAASQLPGTVLIHKGEVLRSHVHRSQADRANYTSLCSLPAPSTTT